MQIYVIKKWINSVLVMLDGRLMGILALWAETMRFEGLLTVNGCCKDHCNHWGNAGRYEKYGQMRDEPVRYADELSRIFCDAAWDSDH